MPKIKCLRWWICGILFLASSLSFLDRQVLSVVAPVMTDEFRMSNNAYSRVVNGFVLSYTVMFFLGGRLIDWLGTRRGMALSVGFWSTASALHGFVQTPFQLGVARFFLGVGEGGCFPGITKGATEWFPRQERAQAVGLGIGGAAFGAVVAPIFTVWLISSFGWRGVFWTTGMIGWLWVLVWLILFRPPRRSPFITPKELAHIEQGDAGVENNPAKENGDRKPLIPLRRLLRLRQVWGLMVIRFLVDPVFYFYMFWIPQYLNQERGLSLQRIGELTWIPFLFLGISNFVGGWISDRLVKSGVSVNTARKTIMAIAALITPFSVLAAYVSSAEMAVAFMSILMLAHGFWITNYVTVISDLFGANSVSTVMGLSGAFGGLGGILGNQIIGVVTGQFSYLPIWIASGCMYPLGLVILFFVVGPIRGIGIHVNTNEF
jgi:ACS family hexuronate transporter-like MFS transporter